MNEFKQCKSCLEIKNVSEFYKGTHNADGLQGWCKACDKGNHRAPNTTTKKEKWCVACGLVKPVSEYYTIKRRYDGLDSRCKTCKKSHRKKLRKARSLK